MNPDAIFSETFAAGLGNFTIEQGELPEGLSYVWSYDSRYTCAKASGFYKQAYDAESYLVSPVIDLTGKKNIALAIDHAGNYFNADNGYAIEDNATLWVRVEGGEWEQVALSAYPTRFIFVPATADLNKYAGKKIQLGFKYVSTAAAAGTWEIRNLVVTGDEATGIAGIEADSAVRTVYSLDGRRLSSPVKGINIINGKKVLVK